MRDPAIIYQTELLPAIYRTITTHIRTIISTGQPIAVLPIIIITQSLLCAHRLPILVAAEVVAVVVAPPVEAVFHVRAGNFD
jgi:hypothetical protein